MTVGDSWGVQQDDLIELKARMVLAATACYEYLSDRKEKKTAVCLGYYHFAHHLWNELSGIHGLYKKGLLTSVEKFLMLREPLGPIEQIFPEIPAGKIARSKSTNELFLDILASRYFALKVGGDYVRRDLVARIRRVSAAKSLSATTESVKDARARYHPLLWVGIRVGNRAWAIR